MPTEIQNPHWHRFRRCNQVFSNIQRALQRPQYLQDLVIKSSSQIASTISTATSSATSSLLKKELVHPLVRHKSPKIKMHKSSCNCGSSLKVKDSTKAIKCVKTPVKKSLNVAGNATKAYMSPYAKSPANTKTVANRCASPTMVILSPRQTITSYSERSEFTMTQVGTSTFTSMRREVMERSVSPIPPRYSNRF